MRSKLRTPITITNLLLPTPIKRTKNIITTSSAIRPKKQNDLKCKDVYFLKIVLKHNATTSVSQQHEAKRKKIQILQSNQMEETKVKLSTNTHKEINVK